MKGRWWSSIGPGWRGTVRPVEAGIPILPTCLQRAGYTLEERYLSRPADVRSFEGDCPK